VDFIQWCMLDGIEIATVYAFSTENWNRDPSEVNTLMSIFAKYAESLTVEASTRNVRVRIFSTGRPLAFSLHRPSRTTADLETLLSPIHRFSETPSKSSQRSQRA
jgi:undecaprenyl diphosphate synthase